MRDLRNEPLNPNPLAMGIRYDLHELHRVASHLLALNIHHRRCDDLLLIRERVWWSGEVLGNLLLSQTGESPSRAKRQHLARRNQRMKAS